tara:strand:- start:1154 stop:2329 length:1176 start_codon:yes stop_codon:yes gene_type:complete
MNLKNGLFVTHEGIGSSIFRSQVLEHCISMKKLGYNLDILTYEIFSSNWNNSVINLKKYSKLCSINLKKAIWIYYPFSELFNLFILIIDLFKSKKTYHFIHARADYTAFLCIILKPFHHLPVVWDCRGDSVDEMKFSSSKYNLFIRLYFKLLIIPRFKLYRSINKKFANKIVYVSNALKDDISSYKSEKSIVIPCPVPSKHFGFDKILRQNFRKKLEFEKNHSVYIYSGSMIGYQSIEKYLYFFKSILNNSNNRLIIATVDLEKAKSIFKSILSKNLIFKSIEYEKMNNYYCASDFALLLREPRPLNYVASPTKFGEYCLSGLKVIHNNSIAQVFEITSVLKNGSKISTETIPKLDDNKRELISMNSKQFFSREFSNKSYHKLYNKILKNT